MDQKVSVEDQFSKLHPCLPVETRIGIIGGGPSGLSAAYALSRLGYNNVTVLEKYHTVSGMCESADIEGKVYDLGGQVLAANSAPTIFHLAKEIGLELEELDSHKLALINSSNGKYQDIQVADDYVAVISLTLELQDKAKDSGRIGVHAMSDIAAELTPAFLESRGLSSVTKSVAYGYTASGYGFVQDMPYAYIHEFTRTSMAGKIRRFKGGYMNFWEAISKSLPVQVHCNTEVVSVRRTTSGVTLHTRSSEGEINIMEFDKLIVSGSFPFKNGKIYRSPVCTPTVQHDSMDLSELERDLFSKVQTIDYYTTVLKISGLEHMPVGFYYFGEFMDDPSTIGNPVAMQRFYADTNVYLFWSYGNAADIMGEKVTELAISVVNRMGGTVEKIVLQRRFKYFPHVNSQDMKDGFYEKMETELQGQQNTYYVGGIVAFELTERNSSYAMSLVRKHFTEDMSMPKFPYVKRLFPLQSNCWNVKREDLDELPGVEFPNLFSLDGYLRHWGTHKVTQDRMLYTWINEEGKAVSKRTFAELHANATCIAKNLLKSSKPIIKPGDRVLLVHIPGLDFIDAFLGCLRARVLPVPVLPPDPLQRGGQALLKIENIAKSSNAVAILSTAAYHLAVRAGSVKSLISLPSKSSAQWPNLPWIHTDSLIKNSKNMHLDDMNDFCEPKDADLCFLQFTSGSTGDAKGVMITHGGLIHNVKLMHKRYRSTSKTVLISWLPQYHDMGLIGGLFTAMVSGATAILFSPMTFIRNPLLWLQTMSKYQATHSAGPNFAVELVVRRLEIEKDKLLNYDLSSMRFLMVAAEPVRQKTLKRFLELTGPYGMSEDVIAPGYGLAENCVFVSCAYGEGTPILVDWQGRVCCGYVNSDNADVSIIVVDPETGKEQEAGKEGEIWICSPSAGIGYWDRKELSQRTFGNVIGSRPGKTYTSTGDLGRIIDGNLFITGRIKDLIIVAGRNIYSADVEKTVESSSELLRPGCCAVIGVPEETLVTKGISVPDGSDQVGLVVIAEVRDGKPISKDVVEQIQARVAEEHGVTIASIKLIRPRTMSKTTSGKIKRFECLKQFSEGTLNLVPDPIVSKRTLVRSFTSGTCKEGITPRGRGPSPLSANPRLSHAEIVEFLKQLVSDQTKIAISKISTTESLVSYGIDSIGVVRAAQKLSDFLGVPVGAVDIFTATCIADLASFSENLVMKSRPETMVAPSYVTEYETDSAEMLTDISNFHQMGIWFLQLLALTYVCIMLVSPAYLSVFAYMRCISFIHASVDISSWASYAIWVACAPLAWILCMFSTCISISFFGNSFLKPNYALTPEVSIWSVEFVKWWALNKAHKVSSEVLAVHLRGTIFLKYWFVMFGARIGSSVLLDTVDITDPSLVSIGDGAVIAEGALVQSHEVKNGILSFLPIRIGKNSLVGPYSVIQKGSVIGEGNEVSALQKTEGGKPLPRSTNGSYRQKGPLLPKATNSQTEAIYHVMGIYMVGLLSSVSAAIVYIIYVWLSQSSFSPEIYAFFCISGAFHWLPFTVIAYAAMIGDSSLTLTIFPISVAIAYITHGIILGVLTSIWTSALYGSKETKQNHLRTWLRHRITIAYHLRFVKFLSGTEAFCIYLRLLGAKVGKHCSIRAINPISEPKLISLGDGVHLGDFCRIIAGSYNYSGFQSGKIEVQDNSVVGSQSLLLPGSVLEKDVILGALSVAPANTILQRGGVYIGSQAPIMIKNTLHVLDERIEAMDQKYKKIVGNLSASLAATTLQVRSRYFHRIGVSGKGVLKIFDKIEGFPDHKIFCPGKSYPVIIRHSNSLSADDDARIDARGAAVRILSDNSSGDNTAILDLTLKTGKAFYARTISDFATWLVCGLPAREEHVKRVPHVREAVWTSLRNADSYAELHYYSNICRIFRFPDGQEMYVKFKLRPCNEKIHEDSGKVEPTSILPPETGAIPRDPSDTRPLLFLADDFQRRVSFPGGVGYIFQLQFQPVPHDEATQDILLDCTKPWNETKFPFIDVGEILIDQNNTQEESEELEFNPFLRCHEVDIAQATSSSQSASIDHGRSLIYEICQHLRNKQPLPESWRIFLEHSDVKVDLSGCPMAAAIEKKDSGKVTLSRKWYQALWAVFAQPLLQTLLPYYLMGLVIFGPLKGALYIKDTMGYPIYCLLPLIWVFSGIAASLACVAAKWILVGRNKDGGTMLIWGMGAFMDTIWQAFRTLAGDYFMEMTGGSFMFVLLMKLMGSNVDISQGAYVDSMGAMLNPEMVEIERGGCVGREALLFGHIYEGEGGKVKFGKIKIEEGGFVGSRAIAMPGAIVETGGSLSALSLAFKGEIVRSR
ncbi:uncharacterized protein LOC135147742 [Daucus carota subsp. sativus]|uniref:Carrier domain-containing protein n=1 Tax=Daucus carota subsp. sativus TaxID=79200 RepID=A0A164STU4_DAUCS